MKKFRELMAYPFFYLAIKIAGKRLMDDVRRDLRYLARNNRLG